MIFETLILAAALILSALCIGHDIRKGLERIADATQDRADT